MQCLLDELQNLAASEQCKISAAVAILDALALGIQSNDFEFDGCVIIMVPDSDGLLRSLDEIYYNDRGIKTGPIRFGNIYAAHSKISRSTANSLQIQLLSSLELGDDDSDDFEDEDMSEDLTTRISGLLRDSPIRYALNEFLANAVDAGASEFSVLVDEQVFETRTIISETMSTMQQTAAIVLYNNAVFQDTDFKGLRDIGRGGKRGVSDTIGRYGFGALSLFHFTEVCLLSATSHRLSTRI
jgi:sacsin